MLKINAIVIYFKNLGKKMQIKPKENRRQTKGQKEIKQEPKLRLRDSRLKDDSLKTLF